MNKDLLTKMANDPAIYRQHLLIDRLKKLERLGIATETGVSTWSLSPSMEAIIPSKPWVNGAT